MRLSECKLEQVQTSETAGALAKTNRTAGAATGLLQSVGDMIRPLQPITLLGGYYSGLIEAT